MTEWIANLVFAVAPDDISRRMESVAEVARQTDSDSGETVEAAHAIQDQMGRLKETVAWFRVR